MTAVQDTLRATSAGFEVPALPDLLRRVLDVTSDPRSSSRDLERVIREDPGLVIELLRTVNSTRYGLRTPISAANHAIVLLGIPVVVSLVSGLLLLNAFRNQPGLDPNRLCAVWRNALACSGLVNVLGRRLPARQRDHAFLAALTQNVGQLALARHFQERYDALHRCGPFPAIVAERRRLGVDHAGVSAYLLDQWRFPREVIAIVEVHHEPERYGGDPREVLLVAVADGIDRVVTERPESLTLATRPPARCLERLASLGWTWSDLVAEREELLRPVTEASRLVHAHTR
ncbi:MAG TPA: HDOD domain-containing protein [Candidatus Krumholzibacteria bacterium]|nr:HDOD domain-containing protein [Candidatus Krumholzibacteria bacterium]HPD70520.1 HDOD domain-containing protein [Candidatus Krumholzibacteria bacterium]HRY39780.1 HDOD domain-containing protein [Candidatus Krumholzibacteria bacterium]